MNLIKMAGVTGLALALTACGGAASSEKIVNNGTATATASKAVASATPGMQQSGVQDVSNAELEALQQKGVTLIDIRLPEEWQQTGVVKNSQLLTFFNASGAVNPQFVSEATAIAAPGGEVAIICRTGNRTRAAAEMLVQAGIYNRVYNVTDGITGWIGAGKPVMAVN
jgi:rhodanese-related sulfurtransferase